MKRTMLWLIPAALTIYIFFIYPIYSIRKTKLASLLTPEPATSSEDKTNAKAKAPPIIPTERSPGVAPIVEVSCAQLIANTSSLPLYIIIPLPAIINPPTERRENQQHLLSWLSDATLSDGITIPNPSVDVVISWMNGTQKDYIHYVTKFKAERHKMMESTRFVNKAEERENLPTSNNHWREWNELKYTVRSVYKNAATWLGKIHLVVQEYPNVQSTAQRKADGHLDNFDTIIQVPAWLNLKAEKLESTFHIVPQNTLFGEKRCLPIFNSMSFEAQLMNLPNRDTDLIYVLSDDMMLGQSWPSTEIYSHLFGLVVQVYSSSWMELDKPSEEEIDTGEEYSIRYTQWLLNQRFGARSRRRIAHMPKAIDLSVLKEAYETFPRDGTRTPLLRFRGDDIQINSWFLSMHYRIERFREALLWSYLSLRMDANHDGMIDSAEKAQIMAELRNGAEKTTTHPRTPVLNEIRKLCTQYDIPKFAHSKPIWTYLDGPFSMRRLNTERCARLYPDCLVQYGVDGPTPANVILTHLVQSSICGDCMSAWLLASSDRGLGPMLPPIDSEYRILAEQTIARYAYTVTSSKTEVFIMLKTLKAMKRRLNSLSSRSPKTFPSMICINDDILDSEVEAHGAEIRQAYIDYFEKVMPDRSALEL